MIAIMWAYAIGSIVISSRRGAAIGRARTAVGTQRRDEAFERAHQWSLSAVAWALVLVAFGAITIIRNEDVLTLVLGIFMAAVGALLAVIHTGVAVGVHLYWRVPELNDEKEDDDAR